MSKLSMTAGGRELLMRFDTEAWLDVEDEFGTIGKMYEEIDGENKPMRAMMRAAVIMANAGERHAGRAPDITLEWMVANLTPKQQRKANTLAKIAVAEGMKRETVESDDEGDIDLVAKELQKKNPVSLQQDNA